MGASVERLLEKNATIQIVVGPGQSLVLIPMEPCGISYVTDASVDGKDMSKATRESVPPTIKRSHITKFIVRGC